MAPAPCAWIRCFAGIALAMLVAGIVPAHADALDRYVEVQRRLFGIPAVVVGVMRDGRLVEARAWGETDVELGVKASVRHAFEIGSISKQFTAYAILMLAAESKLDVDAPIGRYIEGLPDAWGRPSLHQLMTHTSGLPDLEEAFGYGVYRETPTDGAFLERLAQLPLDFAPGDRWKYSNTAYWLLALAIERASGLAYADFMRQRIFTPLGMRSTRSALPPLLLRGRASGYERVDGVLQNRDAMQPATGRGLGDLASTLDDMARWEREQREPRLVARATARQALVPVRLNNGREEPYGYGWSTEPLLGEATLSHDGQTAGFSASYVRVPQRGLAVVVFANAFGAPTQRIAKWAARRAEPALRLPRRAPIADPDPTLTERVVELLNSASRASSAWQAQWFAPTLWADLRPWLPQVEQGHAALGPLKRLSPVSSQMHADGRTIVYRTEYADLTRVRTVKFDAEGRISRLDSEDE